MSIVEIGDITSMNVSSGPVLCLAMHPSGEQCYSGGLDSIITVWNLPNPDVDPYDAYGRLRTRKVNFAHPCHLLRKDSNVLCKVLDGHTDAVWQLAMSGDKLLSCSADRTVRLWDPNLSQPLQSTFNCTFSLCLLSSHLIIHCLDDRR